MRLLHAELEWHLLTNQKSIEIVIPVTLENHTLNELLVGTHTQMKEHLISSSLAQDVVLFITSAMQPNKRKDAWSCVSSAHHHPLCNAAQPCQMCSQGLHSNLRIGTKNSSLCKYTMKDTTHPHRDVSQ